jgi:hypothetical protein
MMCLLHCLALFCELATDTPIADATPTLCRAKKLHVLMVICRFSLFHYLLLAKPQQEKLGALVLHQCKLVQDSYCQYWWSPFSSSRGSSHQSLMVQVHNIVLMVTSMSTTIVASIAVIWYRCTYCMYRIPLCYLESMSLLVSEILMVVVQEGETCYFLSEMDNNN